jgi:hypothetical protein
MTFAYVIINVRHVQSRGHIVNRCAPRKMASDVETCFVVIKIPLYGILPQIPKRDRRKSLQT